MAPLRHYYFGLIFRFVAVVSFFILPSIFSYSASEEEKNGPGLVAENGVRNLRMPGFDDTGMMAWELFAKEVDFQNDGVYEAFDLVLETMTGFNESLAKSKRGLFKPSQGKAWGDTLLEIQGKGFWAQGKRWSWANKIDQGDQLMAFKENGEVLFKENLLLEKNQKPENSTSPKDQDTIFKTHTSANYIEILELSPSQNRFLLEGQVTVKSESLEIECAWMEILFEKDVNASKGDSSLGKISKIMARGKVEMKQYGRRSYADELTIEARTGQALLKGNARVEDDEYGIAEGSEIVLEKGKRRAQVIGGKGKRPSLQLPEIPDFGFPQ
jgi:lipopolysaccharide export system protein LptA